ncbi:MAG: aminotransferase class I/II-fold pyridoxal phosphate-dependent enzyme [Thermodesulfovibrionales bacterium]|jgi:histidinol-phosphate aminotransferase|nr:aminotransferase class I/II-fold pyridoxal phosphate-dependent enzyme [Thermodesulfovibrionales bacterium]
MKYKKWIETIERVRGNKETRFHHARLDKNERLAYFGDEFWKNVMGKLTQEHVLAYPEVEPLYEKLADFLNLTTEHLVVTAGSDSAIRTAFDLFVNPGDKVIFLDPTFAMVEVYCNLYNAEKIKIGYDTNLELDINGFLSAITEGVSLVIIANPNSPTGTYINNKTIEEILKKAFVFGIPVLVDEAYYGFCPYTAIYMLQDYDNLIITRTFSKTAGLAGLRIGYIVAQPALAKLLYKFRPMYEVNSLAVLFVTELLNRWEIVDEYIKATLKGKKYLISELNKLSFKTIDTFANFIHADFKAHKSKILECFLRDKILVRGSLSVKGFQSYTRISVGNEEEMQKAVESIRKSVLL